MRKWIIFRAEKRQPGWEDRKYAHTGSLTKVLCEHFDCSDQAIPEPGYRPKEFVPVEQFADASYPEASTHYRVGDWEVSRVETYTPDVPMGEFDMVVVCYCKYAPVNAPLKPMPERQVTADSFGGDNVAYEQWLEKQKEPVGV
jgi:hypothetical protein